MLYFVLAMHASRDGRIVFDMFSQPSLTMQTYITATTVPNTTVEGCAYFFVGITHQISHCELCFSIGYNICFVKHCTDHTFRYTERHILPNVQTQSVSTFCAKWYLNMTPV